LEKEAIFGSQAPWVLSPRAMRTTPSFAATMGVPTGMRKSQA
jgi:hypothetical protein